MVKSKLYRQKSLTEAYTYTLTKREKGKEYIYIIAPKVHHLNLGLFVVYSGIPHMQGTSSWLWRFNPLLLRLLGEISLSLLCSHSSWGSALDLAPPVRVGHLRASVLHSGRGYRSSWFGRSGSLRPRGGRGTDAGRACGGRGRLDVAPDWGTPCVLPGKLSLDTGPWQWWAAQAPGRGGVDSDLCLHTGFLVAAAAALTFHAHLWCPCW